MSGQVTQDEAARTLLDKILTSDRDASGCLLIGLDSKTASALLKVLLPVAYPLTTEDLARVLECDTRTVLRYRKSGLPAQKIGRGYFYNAQEVEEWLEENLGPTCACCGERHK